MSPAVDLIPIPVLFPLSILLALVAVEAGRWLGKRARSGGTEPEGPVSASVTATLGLLAFVLAFTFAMAASRFDTRRQMVIEDANAIGTLYLRTSLLAEPGASQIRAQLREYVDIRIAGGTNAEDVATMVLRSEQLQSALWKQAAAVATAQPTSTTVPLVIQALNSMIDVHGARLAAMRNRIPATIWVFMFLTTGIGMMAMGYHAGVSSAHRRGAYACLAVAFAAVIMLIADLDRPQQGFLRVSQQPMLDLQRSMQADAAAEQAAR